MEFRRYFFLITSHINLKINQQDEEILTNFGLLKVEWSQTWIIISSSFLQFKSKICTYWVVSDDTIPSKGENSNNICIYLHAFNWPWYFLSWFPPLGSVPAWSGMCPPSQTWTPESSSRSQTVADSHSPGKCTMIISDYPLSPKIGLNIILIIIWKMWLKLFHLLQLYIDYTFKDNYMCTILLDMSCLNKDYLVVFVYFFLHIF